MKQIFGLVGPSGAGKTTLILEIVKRFPTTVGIVKSLTTRPRRGAEDDAFYDFVSPEEMTQRQSEGRLVQTAEYAGNYYANDRETLDALLKEKFGIAALVEDGVNNFRHAGYHVAVIKVMPFHHKPTEDEKRARADEERALTHVPADFVLNNSFEPGGKEKAIEHLATYIQSFAR